MDFIMMQIVLVQNNSTWDYKKSKWSVHGQSVILYKYLFLHIPSDFHSVVEAVMTCFHGTYFWFRNDPEASRRSKALNLNKQLLPSLDSSSCLFQSLVCCSSQCERAFVPTGDSWKVLSGWFQWGPGPPLLGGRLFGGASLTLGPVPYASTLLQQLNKHKEVQD